MMSSFFEGFFLGMSQVASAPLRLFFLGIERSADSMLKTAICIALLDYFLWMGVIDFVVMVLKGLGALCGF